MRLNGSLVGVLDLRIQKWADGIVNRSTPCAMKFLPGPEWEAAGDPRKHDSGGSVFHE
jgi:hypothetical protein